MFVLGDLVILYFSSFIHPTVTNDIIFFKARTLDDVRYYIQV